MVRMGYLCVGAAVAADVCAAFVTLPSSLGSAAGLVGSPHARISVLARSLQSTTLPQRAGSVSYSSRISSSGGNSRRRKLGLQVEGRANSNPCVFVFRFYSYVRTGFRMYIYTVPNIYWYVLLLY